MEKKKTTKTKRKKTNTKKKLLIVEDEKILSDMYKNKFIQSGFEVFAALNSKEGLKLALKKKPDLILLDILLPEEDGIFFLEKLRANPKISSTQVVVFSNYDNPTTKKDALSFDIKDYLLKTDYTPKKIVEKVKSYFK